MVTEDNLSTVGDNLFVTRLPFTYNEAQRVVSKAVAENNWDEVGVLNQTPTTRKRLAARYRTVETNVTLYGQKYRAVVVHSTAHDKRRLKRINHEIRQSVQALRKILSGEIKREYFCSADAEVTASKLRETHNDLHRIEALVIKKVRYGRGRPPKNRPKKVAAVRYVIEAQAVEKIESIQRKRDEAGCFVLLSNVASEGDQGQTAEELLRAYRTSMALSEILHSSRIPFLLTICFSKSPNVLRFSA